MLSSKLESNDWAGSCCTGPDTPLSLGPLWGMSLEKSAFVFSVFVRNQEKKGGTLAGESPASSTQEPAACWLLKADTLGYLRVVLAFLRLHPESASAENDS